MAEILSWPEATAQLWTGAGSTVTVVYCRDVQINAQRASYHYRPPFATTRTHIDLQERPVTMNVGMAEAPDQRSFKAMLYAAEFGSAHFHVFALTPGGGSGGFYGWSGTLAGSLGASEGEAEQRLTFSFQGHNWSAY